MTLAGVSVPAAATADLANLVREVKLLALTVAEREITLDAVDDPPDELD